MGVFENFLHPPPPPPPLPSFPSNFHQRKPHVFSFAFIVRNKVEVGDKGGVASRKVFLLGFISVIAFRFEVSNLQPLLSCLRRKRQRILPFHVRSNHCCYIFLFSRDVESHALKLAITLDRETHKHSNKLALRWPGTVALGVFILALLESVNACHADATGERSYPQDKSESYLSAPGEITDIRSWLECLELSRPDD